MAVPAPSAAAPQPEEGLTTAQAAERLAKDGSNTMPDTSAHPLRNALAKFWAPVPWLLEAAIVLQIVLHKYLEASVIAALLVFNAALAFMQEGHAQATLTALKSKLALDASVRRDGAWKTVPAAALVCGDLIKLSLGGVVAADVHLLDGQISVDQSMLTGESLPLEAAAGADTYAGALVRRGEATGRVTATGARTKFGRTAELIQTAHVVSSQQKAVLKIVRNLAVFNAGIIALIGIYAWRERLPLSETVPLLLTSILGAMPVALPATFTLASAIGARALAKIGVLPTRLSAVDEAATIDVLCSDKTGTLTRNELAVASVRAMPDFEESRVLGLAALACSEGSQDAVDAAVRSAASAKPASNLPKLTHFMPFDPAKKVAEASATDGNGAAWKIVKGAFATVADLVPSSPDQAGLADGLAGQGFRVLAVAAGPESAMRLAGFIALSDPPRDDSAALISELKTLGIRTVMVTGDAPETAKVVAKAVGLPDTVAPPGPPPQDVKPEDLSIYAGILPEGKFNLVKAFQSGGRTVGMCGDGANDAPALRQAQCGIAVSTATDVAKSAAGIVLTQPGLAGIVATVKEGRTAFQRILTYTLNSVTKKIVQVSLLAAGLLMTGHAVLTPMLMVIVMITGDFLAMSLTTDRVSASEAPNSWDIGRITAAGGVLAACLLGFCAALLAFGYFHLRLPLAELRTLSVVAVVFGSQAMIYAVRERKHFFGPRPSVWLVRSSMADVVIISTLAWRGIAMAALPPLLLFGEFAAAFIFYVILNGVKIPLFRKLRIS